MAPALTFSLPSLPLHKLIQLYCSITAPPSSPRGMVHSAFHFLFAGLHGLNKWRNEAAIKIYFPLVPKVAFIF